MARCRVCHRELTSADAIAAGIGPVCARKSAARMAGAAQTGPRYPRDRYARIMHALEALAEMWSRATMLLAAVRGDPNASAAERAEAERVVALRLHWYQRVQRMEGRAAALLAA